MEDESSKQQTQCNSSMLIPSTYSRVKDTNIAVQIVDVIIKDFCDLAISRPLVRWDISMTLGLNDLNTFSQVTSRVDDNFVII